MPLNVSMLGAILLCALLAVGCKPSTGRGPEANGVRCAYAVEFLDLRARNSFLERNAVAIADAVHARAAYIVSHKSNDLIIFAADPGCSLNSAHGFSVVDGLVSTHAIPLTQEINEILYRGSWESVIAEKETRECAISIEQGPPLSSNFTKEIGYVGLNRITIFGSGEAIFLATDNSCSVTKALLDRVYKNTLGDIGATTVRVCQQQSLEECNVRATASVPTPRK